MGSPDHPVNPLSLALGAESTFIARTVDTNTKHLVSTLERAAAHKGTSFVEVFQNCNIYNDGAFMHLTAKDVLDDRTLVLEHGQPMIFGKDTTRHSPERLIRSGHHGETASRKPIFSSMMKPTIFIWLTLSAVSITPTSRSPWVSCGPSTNRRTATSFENRKRRSRGEGDLDVLFNNADTWVVEDD